jgi:hypothetical protein
MMDRETSVWEKKFLSGTASAESAAARIVAPTFVDPTNGRLLV